MVRPELEEVCHERVVIALAGREPRGIQRGVLLLAAVIGGIFRRFAAMACSPSCWA